MSSRGSHLSYQCTKFEVSILAVLVKFPGCEKILKGTRNHDHARSWVIGWLWMVCHQQAARLGLVVVKRFTKFELSDYRYIAYEGMNGNAKW